MDNRKEARSHPRALIWGVSLFILIVVPLIVLEVGLRFLFQPSGSSGGRFGDVHLPPIPLLVGDTGVTEDASLRPVNDDEHPDLTAGDTHGMVTFHPTLGYTQRADAVSKNGWCRLNNVAARWDKPVARATTPGLQRVLMMGDSYTHGFGLRQEDVWTSQLASISPGLEPLNFGVTGYSIAQAYLRFQELRQQMDYDTVVLSIVPRADFWRDINVIRTAVFPDWRMDMPMPRAVIKDDALSFVHQHYESIEAFRAENSAGISDTLRKHLETYDRFYFDSLYEDTPVIGNSMVYKTIVRVLAKFRRTALLKQYRDPESEAANITHAIMTAMQSDAEADGARFVAFILPMEHEIDDLQSDAQYARDRQDVSERLCQGIDTCVDVASYMAALPAGCIDTAATNSHYGPKLSRAFAYLAQLVLDPETSEARVPEGQCNPFAVPSQPSL